MTWKLLDSQSAKKSAVVITASAPTRNRRRVLTLFIRTDQLENQTFLTARARVDGLIGSGEHAGMLRLVPGTRFVLGSTARNEDLVRVNLPEIPPMPEGKRISVPVEFDYGGNGSDQWLEITLPAWGTADTTEEVVEAKPVAAKPATPYRGALASQKHTYPQGSV